MRARDHQLHAGEAALDQVPQEVGPEDLRLARTDVQPDDLAPAMGGDGHSHYDGDGDDAPTFPHFEVSGIEPQIRPFSGERALQEARHPLVDVLLQSLDTEDFEMPLRPMAWTRSSTRRVLTPAIQASWITATSAFSTVRRGSRKPGK